jgi:hypothetical protein
LGFATIGEPPVVEVVSVAERTIPQGRSELALGLPQVAAPVLEHQWRLLLPEGARYRFKSGDLQPAHERPEPPENKGSGRLAGFSDRSAGAGVRGTVKDEHGQPLPGVTVVVSSAELAQPVIVVTRGDGSFVAPDLPPGRYRVKAELEGFPTVEMPEFRIPTGKFADLEIELSVQSVSETIVVTGESPPLRNAREVAREEERRKKDEAAQADRDAFRQEARELKQGLVGGVKPLPVAIPETGKVLLLSGALPPPRVGVALEVKGKR